jgi:hypothetical protein
MGKKSEKGRNEEYVNFKRYRRKRVVEKEQEEGKGRESGGRKEKW